MTNSSKKFDEISRKSNVVLPHLSKGLANRLAPHLDKTHVIKCNPNNCPRHALHIGYNEKYIEVSVNAKFIGLKIYNHLHWPNHIEKMIAKLSEAQHAVRPMYRISNTDTS
jgi:hypothetical protein